MDCCLHCECFSMKRDYHFRPCPQGCNDDQADITFRVIFYADGSPFPGCTDFDNRGDALTFRDQVHGELVELW